MLRLPLVLLSAIAGVMIVIGSAYALPEGQAASSGVPKKVPGRQERAVLSTLVKLPNVQKELNLTAEQKKQIQEMESGGGRGPGAGTATTMIGPRGGIGGGGRVTDRGSSQFQLAKILKPEQLERLKQISLQMQGVSALCNSQDTIDELGLTLEQQEKLKAVFMPASKQTGKKPMTSQLAQQVRENALKVLTPEQRERFNKMQGKRMTINPFGATAGASGMPAPAGGPR